MDIYSIPLTRIDGTVTNLGDYRGKVLLVVNTASKCGLTPQYTGLEKLYQQHRDAGLEILAFPANDFAGQEPGTDQEIAKFCSTDYPVSFPLFSKVTVVGPDKHSLFAELIARRPESHGRQAMVDDLAKYGITANPAPELTWNFEKFVIGRNGEVVARFSPDTKPDAPELIAVLEQELGR